jgi:hypothetical protein
MSTKKPMIESTPKKYTANKNTVTNTTPVVACTCFMEGVVTFRISVRTSFKKLELRSKKPTVFSPALRTIDSSAIVFATEKLSYFVRLLTDLAGAEGFEPPSPVLETGSLAVELTPLISQARAYFVSLCDVCFLQRLQYLLNSSRPVVVFLFLVVE